VRGAPETCGARASSQACVVVVCGALYPNNFFVALDARAAVVIEKFAECPLLGV
jgi:hypothetical protein